VGIDFVKWNGELFIHVPVPIVFYAKGIEIGNQGASLAMINESGNLRLRFPNKQVKGNIFFGEFFFHLPQSLQHEGVLSDRRSEVFGDQAEDDRKGGVQFQCQFLGEKQCPVVIRTLVPAHPVDDRSARLSNVI
jgi:hypothetical protein